VSSRTAEFAFRDARAMLANYQLPRLSKRIRDCKFTCLDRAISRKARSSCREFSEGI